MPEDARENPELSGEELLAQQGLSGEMLAADDEEKPAEPVVELLIFAGGDEEYALNVFQIREIIRYQPVTVIPRCPDYILGIISLRGEVVPVLDLRSRLGLGRTPLEGEPMIIIVKHGEESAGFLVANISGIIKVREREVETTPEIVSPDKVEFFTGVVRSGHRLATVLNLDRLLDVSGDFGSDG